MGDSGSGAGRDVGRRAWPRGAFGAALADKMGHDWMNEEEHVRRLGGGLVKV